VRGGAAKIFLTQKSPSARGLIVLAIAPGGSALSRLIYTMLPAA